jgi:predicted nucleic-acid-binding Zn-ribbon protein
MLSGECPKCGSHDVLVSRHPGGIWNRDHGKIGQEINGANVAQFFAQGWHTCLCTGCGYCEFYLDDDEAIARIRDNLGLGGKWPETWTKVVASGWYADPTGRHQTRRWSGLRWTAEVEDDGVRSDDPRPV